MWIDSQTEEEILRGIREAKDLSAYDNLAASAYLRAKEDYLMGINFSRVLSLRYRNSVSNYLSTKYQAISVGRVMTCVLGMVVRREREIRAFVKTPFYRVISSISLEGENFDGEWRAVEGSRYNQSPYLYKENGFKKKEHAQELVDRLSAQQPLSCRVESIERKKNIKIHRFYITWQSCRMCAPSYLRSARTRRSALCRSFMKKTGHLSQNRCPCTVHGCGEGVIQKIFPASAGILRRPMRQKKRWLGILEGHCKTRYVNDKQITDHYAIIPTGQGLSALNGLSLTSQRVYETIVRRFLCIFYPPAVYQKVNLTTKMGDEAFFLPFKVLMEEGYLKIAANSFARKKAGEKRKAREAGMQGRTRFPVMRIFWRHCRN